MMNEYQIPQLVNEENFVDLATEERYAPLKEILDAAYKFAAYEKGEQRHGASGKPWAEQRHFEIAQEFGQGFPIGQAMKKLGEGFDMEDWKATRREYLGAITYIASAIFAGDQGID